MADTSPNRLPRVYVYNFTKVFRYRGRLEDSHFASPNHVFSGPPWIVNSYVNHTIIDRRSDPGML